ncbi:hypothetical protein [Pseudoramibacter alactolyticus]
MAGGSLRDGRCPSRRGRGLRFWAETGREVFRGGRGRCPETVRDDAGRWRLRRAGASLARRGAGRR